MNRSIGLGAGCVLLVAGLCLVATMRSPAQETKKTERAEPAEEARKRKLDELMKRVKQEFSQAECVFCHEEISPNIIKEFRIARDGERTGTQCTDCHGSDHAAIIRSKGRVPPERCQECHPKRFEETMSGGGHSRVGSEAASRPIPGNAPGELVALSQSLGREVAERCTSCHSRHKFSKDEAKDPRTCGVCHTGPDRPETDAYLGSKHGLIWRVEGDTGRAPTCVTCHMLAGNHNVSALVIYGSAMPKVPNAPLSREHKRKRELQVKLCSQCHSERFARDQLEMGDRVYRHAQAALDEATGIVKKLRDDGIPDLVSIEQRVFRLDRFWRGATWKSLVHGDLIGPVWNGWYRIDEELAAIRYEAGQLRTLHSLESPRRE